MIRLETISVGKSHCLGLDQDGRLYGWGYNMNGELLIRERVRIDRLI